MPPLLIVFLGSPGSGKTYFASRLADKLKAVTLNSDALRLSMFGSLEKIEKLRQTHQSRLHSDVFGAMNYAAGQALRAGHSVVYDAQQTKRRSRRNAEKLAGQSGAVPILVWIKTDRQTAINRGQQRESREDSHVYSEEKMKMLVNRFESLADLPQDDENVIEISGQMPFSEQFEQFERQLSQYLDQ